MRLLSLLTGLSALFTTSSAAQLTISIPPSPPSLPNPNTLPPSTHASLLGPQGSIQTARLSRSNTLTFPSIPSGSHLLTLHARDHSFSPARIDVDGESIRASVTFRGNEWGNLGPAMGNSTDGQLMIEMRPTGKKDFYQRREGFNVLSIFRNPMILMAVFSGALVFGMPYLMDNMDDETKAEMAKAQESGPLAGAVGGDAASAIQNFDFASWMAGKGAADGKKSPAEVAASMR